MNRGLLHRLARVLIACSMVATAVFGYASNQLLDEDAFAGLITRSIEDEEVRELLANKAVDIAIDSTDADVLLADALPDELALVASPALELSKPALAEAGAILLGVDRVADSLDAAARSVHRQTSAAIIAEEDTDVVVSAMPVLVVVADAIAGDLGARAAVGLELGESANAINLGSNQNALWTVVRLFGYLAAISAVVWLLSVVLYYASARKGQRLLATRRLGRTFTIAGVVTVVIGLILATACALITEAVLSPGDAVSFGGISVGGLADGGGAALADIVVGPLIGAARRSILIGLAIVAATYLMGRGQLAIAVRQAIQNRDRTPVIEALRALLPEHFRQTQLALNAGLVLLLALWPQITLRVAITLVVLYIALWIALTFATSVRAPWHQLRDIADFEAVVPVDSTARSDGTSSTRRAMTLAWAIIALIWPSYGLGGFALLAGLVAGAFALTYVWELRSPDRLSQESPLGVSDADLVVGERWSPRRKLAVAAAATVALLALINGGDPVAPVGAVGLQVSGPRTCNGLENLCSVPIDEVVFAGTHNSMSAAELGWELANHELAIPAQLDAGIRALLIDVAFWADSLEALDLDPEAARVAANALNGAAAPDDGLWMCHAHCQLGATPFQEFLADLRAFLETNPDEVVIVVIQDMAPAADIKAAIEAASIDEFAYSHEPGEPWPTLGEMIESGERVVLMAENAADEDGWYQLAFEGNVEDTGFKYPLVEDFECGPNRGGDDADFFMINHWVETGLPIAADADRVNSRAVLTERINECVAAGRKPGIIAVNFWERGDLLDVVRDLNLALAPT